MAKKDGNYDLGLSRAGRFVSICVIRSSSLYRAVGNSI